MLLNSDSAFYLPLSHSFPFTLGCLQNAFDHVSKPLCPFPSLKAKEVDTMLSCRPQDLRDFQAVHTPELKLPELNPDAFKESKIVAALVEATQKHRTLLPVLDVHLLEAGFYCFN